MDTSTITAPHMPAPNTWKAQKRIPEREAGLDDDDDMASVSDIESNHKKRFRPADSDSCCESPVNGALMIRPKKLFLGRNEQRFCDNVALSPITEISMNMSEATLETPGARGTEAEEDEAADGTPLKGWRNSQNSGKHKLNHFARMLHEKDQKLTMKATSNNTEDDDPKGQQREKQGSSNPDTANNNADSSCFQMSRNGSAASTRGGARRLNMDSSLQEMAVDELSFYEDEASSHHHHSRSFTASPQLMGLLSPEGSPQRFQIVDKSSAVAASTKFLQPLQPRNHKQQQQSAAVSTTSSNTTPAKSFRMFHSLSSGSMESSMDDEYMELFEMESLEAQSSQSQQLGFPSDLSSLICGQIKTSSSASKNNSLLTKTPEMRRPSVRRCLSMTENQQQQQQPKTPELLKQVQDTASMSTTPFASRLSAERSSSSHGTNNSCFKRPEPPSTTCSPVQCKRYRGEEKENLNGSYIAAATAAAAAASASSPSASSAARPSLRKCMSMNDAEIMSALARSDCKDQPDLIGDFSKPFALPLMDGRHQDLKSVSSHTVARLLNGEFDDQVASYKIIDCRYPYEFEGGHIRGAKNLYTQEQIIEEFLNQQKTEQQQARSEAAGHKRNIIIFHCEFSSERGPKLSRFLRNNDRARNTNAYPALDYPEIYLLHNGYKEFYETHAELCDPIAYRPMLEPSYSEAYRHFRAKSKSWNGDGLGGATSRLKKSRSRLLL